MQIRIFRVIVPVASIERAARFYERVLGTPGERVSGGRHYFHCGSVILACFSPREDGNTFDPSANPNHIYFAVDDLEACYARCQEADCSQLDEEIADRPWGERSFYAEDPFGNRICFVDDTTLFMGSTARNADATE